MTEDQAKTNYRKALDIIDTANALHACQHFTLKKAEEVGTPEQRLLAVKNVQESRAELFKARDELHRARTLLEKAEWDGRKK